MFKLLRVLAAATLSFAATAGHAAWPDRPITLVVPFTPGTGIDLIARQLAASLPHTLGQPVVVENLAGASGNIGSEKVARANPDGYTFLVTVNTFVMNSSLYKGKLRFDPQQDFAPVGLTSWGSLLLVTHPSNPANTAADVVQAAKAAPGKLSYGTPGVGTPHHLSMALFLDRTGKQNTFFNLASNYYAYDKGIALDKSVARANQRRLISQLIPGVCTPKPAPG